MAAGRTAVYRGTAGRGVRAGAAAGGARQAGWPAMGAAIAGLALAVGLLGAGAVLLGLLQWLGWVAVVPAMIHVGGAYVASAAGGWTAGRLAGRRGAVVGLAVGAAFCGLALWAGSAVGSGPPDPPASMAVDWPGVVWRCLLAIGVAALAGAMGVGP